VIRLSQNRTAERDRVKANRDFDVHVLALRALAERLADVRRAWPGRSCVVGSTFFSGSGPEPEPRSQVMGQNRPLRRAGPQFGVRLLVGALRHHGRLGPAPHMEPAAGHAGGHDAKEPGLVPLLPRQQRQ
jgi:hypothetical protein